MHGTVGIMLAYLNCHAYIVFVVVFTLVGRFTSGSNLLVCLLVVAGSYYYYCLSDNQRWPCTKVEGTGSLPLGQSTSRDG